MLKHEIGKRHDDEYMHQVYDRVPACASLAQVVCVQVYGNGVV